MATVTYTVGGPNSDYATVAAAAAAISEPGNDVILLIEGDVTEAGFTFSNANAASWTIRPDSRRHAHYGVPRTGRMWSLTSPMTFSVLSGSVTLEDLELDASGSSGTTILTPAGGSQTFVGRRLLVHGLNASSSSLVTGVNAADATANVTLENCVIYDIENSGTGGVVGVDCGDLNSTALRHLTVADIRATGASGDAVGLRVQDEAGSVVQNCLVQSVTSSGGTATDYGGTYASATTTGNASEDTSSPDGTTGVAATFVDSASGDYRLNSQVAATDLGDVPAAEDIEQVSRYEFSVGSSYGIPNWSAGASQQKRRRTIGNNGSAITDYATLAAWEATFLTSNPMESAEVMFDTQESDSVVFKYSHSGIVRPRRGQCHDGIPGKGIRLVGAELPTSTAFSIGQNGILRFEDLEFTCDGKDTRDVIVWYSGIQFYGVRCIFGGIASNSTDYCAAVRFAQASATAVLRDCLLHDITNLSSGDAYGTYNNASNIPITMENCTIADIAATTGDAFGVYIRNDSSVTLRNNLVHSITGGAGTEDYLNGDTSTNWVTAGNVSEDATSPDTAGRNQSPTFEDSANGNWRLAASIGIASDLGDVDAATDVVGRDRHGRRDTWDAGFHQFVTPPDSITTPVRTRYDFYNIGNNASQAITLDGTGSNRAVIAHMSAHATGGVPRTREQVTLNGKSPDYDFDTGANHAGNNVLQSRILVWLDAKHPGAGTWTLTKAWNATSNADSKITIVELQNVRQDKMAVLSAFQLSRFEDLVGGTDTANFKATLRYEKDNLGLSLIATSSGSYMTAPTITDVAPANYDVLVDDGFGNDYEDHALGIDDVLSADDVVMDIDYAPSRAGIETNNLLLMCAAVRGVEVFGGGGGTVYEATATAGMQSGAFSASAVSWLASALVHSAYGAQDSAGGQFFASGQEGVVPGLSGSLDGTFLANASAGVSVGVTAASLGTFLAAVQAGLSSGMSAASAIGAATYEATAAVGMSVQALSSAATTFMSSLQAGMNAGATTAADGTFEPKMSAGVNLGATSSVVAVLTPTGSFGLLSGAAANAMLNAEASGTVGLSSAASAIGGSLYVVTATEGFQAGATAKVVADWVATALAGASVSASASREAILEAQATAGVTMGAGVTILATLNPIAPIGTTHSLALSLTSTQDVSAKIDALLGGSAAGVMLIPVTASLGMAAGAVASGNLDINASAVQGVLADMTAAASAVLETSATDGVVPTAVATPDGSYEVSASVAEALGASASLAVEMMASLSAGASFGMTSESEFALFLPLTEGKTMVVTSGSAKFIALDDGTRIEVSGQGKIIVRGD